MSLKIARFGRRIGTRLRRIVNIYAEIVRRRSRQLVRTKSAYPIIALVVAGLGAWSVHFHQTREWPAPLGFHLWWVATLFLASAWLIGAKSLRKNARRSLGRLGLIGAVCVGTIGLVLSLHTAPSVAFWTTAVEVPFESEISQVGLFWVSMFLSAAGLALVLRIVSAIFASVLLHARIGKVWVTRSVTASSLFAMCYVLGALGWAEWMLGQASPSNVVFATMWPIVVGFVGILFRHDPWRRTLPSLPALLPHSLLLLAIPFLAFGLDPDATFAGIDVGYPTIGVTYLAVVVGLALRLLHWVLVGLRTDLVSTASAITGESWLSTQPDAATYVPSAYAGRVLDYIERANSGVIGVTGVRGAGKSALFKHVLQQCAGRFGRLEMTAPVAYERGTQSLMTLCRELAQRVIRDVEPALQGRPSPAVRAVRDLARRVPALLVLTLFVAIFVGYGAAWTYERIFNLQTPDNLISADVPFIFDRSYPEAVRIWPTNEVIRDPPRLLDTFASLREAEASVIDKVVADARRVSRLMQAEDERSSTRFIVGTLLSPAANSGFTFAPVSTQALPDLATFARSWSLDANEVIERASDVAASASLYRYRLDDNGEAYAVPTQSVDQFVDVFYFNYHVMGHGSELAYHVSIIKRSLCLEFIRGDLSLESRFAANTHSLRSLLNDLQQRQPSAEPARDEREASASATAPRPTQLASLLLLEAWRRQPEGVFFTAEDLGRLIVLLEEYLTLFPGTAQAIEVAEETEPSAGSIYDRWFQLGRAHWLTILITVLLVLIYPIGRSAVLILRGLVNFRYVGLMREAESFLTYLAYSDARELSAGWAARGFTIGGKRTMTARSLTLESLTARYLDFLQTILPYYNNKFVIVIDELDKVIEPMHVRDFLLELKGALFGRGCFYLISISEDAARAFRGRLAEGRDIFESTFDYVVEIDRMSPDAAAGMIRKRLEKSAKAPQFSEDAVLLLTVFGGGIPREIIRHFSDVCLTPAFAKRVPPRDLAVSLFHRALDEWENQLPDSRLSGEKVVGLRDSTASMRAAISDLGARAAWPSMIRRTLSQILMVVDPERLFLTGPEESSDEPTRERTRKILKEAQRVVWLMVLDGVMTDFWDRERHWRDTARRALDAAVVLPDKPALALALMDLLPAVPLPPKFDSTSIQAAE
jgi:hypothetical protein